MLAGCYGYKLMQHLVGDCSTCTVLKKSLSVRQAVVSEGPTTVEPVAPTCLRSFSAALMSTPSPTLPSGPFEIAPFTHVTAFTSLPLLHRTFPSPEADESQKKPSLSPSLGLTFPPFLALASFGRLLHSSSVSHVPAEFLRKRRLCGDAFRNSLPVALFMAPSLLCVKDSPQCPADAGGGIDEEAHSEGANTR